MNFDFISYNSFSLNRRFGVELEIGNNVSKAIISKIIKKISTKDAICTGYGLSYNNDYWQIKDDSTCGVFGKNGPKGIEIVSYVANNQSDVLHIANVAKNLFLCGCRVNKNCGMHIHAEMNDFPPEQLGVLLSYYFKIEHWIENMLPKYRVNNYYCKSLRNFKCINKKKFWDPKEFLIEVAPKNLKTFNNSERKVSLNIINYIKFLLEPSSKMQRNTIEFRAPEGTLNYNDILFWTYFFVNFIENCKNKKMPSNLLPVRSLNNFLQIAGLDHEKNRFFIFDQILFDTRNWVLERLSSYGNSFSKKESHKKTLLIS